MYETVGRLESSHPEAVADMMGHAAIVFPVGSDEIVRSAVSGNV